MDWILKKIIEEQGRDRRIDRGKGIEWIDFDLDFADDIALLENSWAGMQTMTPVLEEEAKKFGLVINVAKTKIMTVGNWKTTGKIEVESKEIEECHEFCYLGSTITNDGGCDLWQEDFGTTG